MCGRYALGAGDQDILDGMIEAQPRLYGRLRRRGGGGGNDGGGGVQRLRGGDGEHTDVCWERRGDFWPSYNIAPKQRAPVIYADGDEAVIETMQWGLIPHWTKYPPSGPLNTINARSETLLDPSAGGMWHALKGHKRCVVPAQGYYEWQKKGTTKVAHFTRLPLTETTSAAAPPLLFFAGLYDTVKYVEPVASKFQPTSPDDTREPYPTGNPVPLSTFTILTTAPARDISWLHDRMPCILQGEDEVARWLDFGREGWREGKDGTGALLRSVSGLDCYPVLLEVGKIGHSSPSYIQPVAERSDGIKSFFQKQSPAKASPARSKPAVKKEEVDRKADARHISVKVEGNRGEPGSQLLGRVDGEVEVGMGDDSNAPNLAVEDGRKVQATTIEEGHAAEDVVSHEHVVAEGSRKRKAGGDDEEAAEHGGSDDSNHKPTEKASPRRGGHQTKVVRKEIPKEPSIAAFFKPPEAKRPRKMGQ